MEMNIFYTQLIINNKIRIKSSFKRIVLFIVVIFNIRNLKNSPTIKDKERLVISANDCPFLF